ncbi:MAG: hypothetical protein GY820_42170 [Gammaproteobacteria bacterium]|nr:hypothetical protein [Gammaproteobacteria bacterium]
MHWGLPIGSFFIFFAFTYDIHRSIAFSLAYIFLIFIHEIGHAIAARLLGLHLFKIELFGLGGVGHVEPAPQTRFEGIVLYSSGVLAQLVILMVTVIYLSFFGDSKFLISDDIVFTFTYLNMILLVLNLIPSRLTSGYDSDGKMIFHFLRMK